MNHALFSLTGRLTRRDFALTLGVISGGVFFAMLALCYLLFPLTASAAVGFFRDSTEVFFTVYIAAFLGLNLLLYALIPPLAIPAVVRRLHDLGHGGGWAAPMLLLCVPVLLLMLLPIGLFIGILNDMIGPSFPLWNGTTEAFASAVVASMGIALLLFFLLFLPLACWLGWLFLKKGKPEANCWGDPPVEEVLPPTRAAYFSTAGTVTRTAFIRRSLLLLLVLGLVLPPAAQLILHRIRGVSRPTIATPMPTPDGVTLMLDSGANVDSKPEHLVQSAVMGSLYAQYVFGVERPRVGLLNIGEEETKGNEQAKETYPLLKTDPNIYFCGNAEGRDVPKGNFDVVVCDGFVGNVVLKFAEGLAKTILGLIREEIRGAGLMAKLGALLLMPTLRHLGKRLDVREYGGAPLLGVNGCCVIGHGSSDAKSIASAIGVTVSYVNGKVLDQIRDALAKEEEETGRV